MIYENPIILSDYSDPDCIRVKDNYYMVASSFNHTPALPILKSKNLVDWKLLRYAFDELPFEKYNEVCHGDAVWAPSIRYHNNKYYIIIPFPDEGVFVTETDDIENGEFSPLRKLIDIKGIIDPCPLWLNDKCYLVVGFAKSRIGFNSCLGLFEVSNDLTKNLSGDYKIIFDGHNTQPTIEGPKFYYINDYIYILAPAGSVKAGWQVALRSKNIYGPYEEKIIMLQNDSKVNGPHQGALIDLPNNKWAFIHFQDRLAYGRVVHLQPVEWHNDWPLCGDIKDPLLGGTPVSFHEYLVDKKSNYKIEYQDDFKGNKLSLMWQTPANKTYDFYRFDDGLILNACYHEKSLDELNLYPNSLLTKIVMEKFKVEVKVNLNLCDNDEAGFVYMGMAYSYLAVKKINGKNHLLLKSGEFKNKDIILEDIIYDSDEIIFNMKFFDNQTYALGYNGKYFKNIFTAKPGRWIGGKYGIYARSFNKNSNGYACFKYFKVRRK